MGNKAVDYYYLPHIKIQRVKMEDLQRHLGMRYRSVDERYYVYMHSSPSGSLQFCLMLLNILGKEGMKARYAEMKRQQNWQVALVIKLVNGLEVIFTGVKGGYESEASRACHDILKVCGFSQKQCNYPFEKELFSCSTR